MGDEATWTPLHIAVAAGQVELVSAILKHSGGLNATDSTGATPVHLCCQRKSWVCLNVLLHHGADAVAVTHEGDTPLHVACQYNAVNCCRSLLLKGCSWNVRNAQGETALHKCIAGRHAGCVVEVLRCAPAVGGCDDPLLEWAYIHEAAVRNSALVLGLLHKASPSVKLGTPGPLGLSAVHLAAMVDASDCIKYLLNQRAPGSQRDRYGSTPLHWACCAGAYESSHLLIRHSAEMEAVDALGRTPLHVAAVYGREGCMRLMLQRGMNPGVRCTKLGRTPLHYAAVHGTVPCVELLLTGSWACKVNAKDDKGMTPLYLAARTGDLATAVVLIKQGAALHAACHDGTTPLIMTCVNNSAGICGLLTGGVMNPADPRMAVATSWAARHGSIEVLRLLLDKGCDAGTLSQEGLTLLMDAAWGGHAGVCQFLLNANAVAHTAASPATGETAAILACKRGHGNVLRCLINHAESVDSTPGPMLAAHDRRGYTCLHYAAAGGYASLVNLLLSHTTVPPPSTGRVSPFHCAVRGGHLEALHLMQEKHNADLARYVDEKQATPLHWAAFYGEAACAEFCVAHSDVDAVDAAGQTALHKACMGGHEGIVGMLLAAGADARAKSVHGWEAVHHAAKASYECLHRLMKSCEEWQEMLVSTTNTMQTPLHLAVKGGDPAAVDLLLENGADPEAADTEGLRPVDWAALDATTDTNALLHALTPRSRKHGRALHMAALAKKQDAVIYLLDAGFDPASTDTDGRSAAHVAAGVGAVGTLSLLPPALLGAGDKQGLTPFHIAAQCGRVNVFETLFNDSHFDATDAEGKTFTHHAAAHGHVDVLRYLVEILGASPNGMAHPGRSTPLLEACSGGHLPVVLYILSLPEKLRAGVSAGAPHGREAAGESVTLHGLRCARDADGNTALHLAALQGHSDVAQALLKRGFFLNTMNMHGWTPVDCCTGENNPMISEEQKRSLCEVFRVWCDVNPEPPAVTSPLAAELQRIHTRDSRRTGGGGRGYSTTIALDQVLGGAGGGADGPATTGAQGRTPQPPPPHDGGGGGARSYSALANYLADTDIHQADLVQGADRSSGGDGGPRAPVDPAPLEAAAIQRLQQQGAQLLAQEEALSRRDVEMVWREDAADVHAGHLQALALLCARQRDAAAEAAREAADAAAQAARALARSTFLREPALQQIRLAMRNALLSRYFMVLRLWSDRRARRRWVVADSIPVPVATGALAESTTPALEGVPLTPTAFGVIPATSPATPATTLMVPMDDPDAADTPWRMEGLGVLEMNRADMFDAWLARLGDATRSEVYGLTPLQAACMLRRPEMVALLLTRGVDPNYPRHDPPLLRCVTHNTIDCLMLVCADPRTDLGAIGPHGMRVLEHAAWWRRYEMVDYLIGLTYFQNAAVCLPRDGAAGCIATVNEVLAGRGASLWSLLSPGAAPAEAGSGKSDADDSDDNVAPHPCDNAGMEVLSTRIRNKLYLLQERPDGYDAVYMRFVEALAEHVVPPAAAGGDANNDHSNNEVPPADAVDEGSETGIALSLKFLSECDLKERTERGKSLLHVAVEQRCDALVVQDILACAETRGELDELIAGRDIDGKNILHTTLRSPDDAEMFIVLVELLANLFAARSESEAQDHPRANVLAALLPVATARGDTVVHLAAHSHVAACIPHLVTHVGQEHVAALLTTPDGSGLYPVHRAARAGHGGDVLSLLLPSGMGDDPHAVDAGPLAYTPLMHAVYCGRAVAVEYLLSQNAPLTLPNGEPALHVAVALGSEGVVTALLEDARCDAEVRWGVACDTAVHVGAQHNTGGCVEAVLAVAPGGFVNAVNAKGDTPLHTAALFESLDVVAVLLAVRGVDLEVRNAVGNTVLHNACAGRSVGVVRALLAAGVNTAVAGAFGATALQVAVMQPDLSSYHISGVRFDLADTAEPQVVNADFLDADGTLVAGIIQEEEEAAAASGSGSLSASRSAIGTLQTSLVPAANAFPTLKPTRRTTYVFDQPQRLASWASSAHSSVESIAVLVGDAWWVIEDSSTCVLPVHAPVHMGFSGRANEAPPTTTMPSEVSERAQEHQLFNRITAVLLFENCAVGAPSMPLCALAVRSRRHVALLQLLALQVDPAAADDDGVNAFHAACTMNDVEALRVLLMAGTGGASAFNAAGRTPLHEAIRAGARECVRLLVNSEVGLSAHEAAVGDATASDRRHDVTPLHEAVIAGNVELVDMLLAAGVEDVATRTWGSLLHCAAENRARGVLLWLLEHGRSPQDAIAGDGATVMHFAAKDARYLEELKLMCEHGGRLDTPITSDGYSPFHVACAHANKDVIAYATAGGATGSDAGENGVAMWQLGAGGKGVPILAVLHRRDETLLGELLTTSPFKESEALWESLAGCNTEGYTPLHVCVQEGYHAEVRVLLEAGLKPTRHKGGTLLHLASSRDRCLPTLRYLLAHFTHGVRADDHDVGSASALGAEAKVQTTREPVFRLDDIDDEGLSPLHYACRCEAVQCAAMLLRCGADMDLARPPSLVTPMMTATAHGSDKCLRYLLRMGADRDARDERGDTALAMAAACGSQYVAWLLQTVTTDPVASALRAKV